MISIEVERQKQTPEERREKVRERARAWRLANPERAKAKTMDWAAKNQDRVRASQNKHSLMRRYGLSVDDFDRLMREQGGLCAICVRPSVGERLCVDHEHVDGFDELSPAAKSKLVRGLLCRKCNTGIGMLRDNPDLLARAVEYMGVK